MSRRPTLRFAPSPNGRLHLGHAYSALLNAKLARQMGGRLLLRIEDIDPARSKPGHIAGIIEDLAWLGIEWEQPVRRQSEHMGQYKAAADELLARGLLYPCFASRKEIEAAAGAGAAMDPDAAPLYPGLWRGADPADVVRRKAAGEPYALRLDMAAALRAVLRPLSYSVFDPATPEVSWPVIANPERWGDAVIVRKETPTSYHLSVVLDDALQGVTHVVRGQDLEAATDLHRLLQALLRLPVPLYHHHSLIEGPDGKKLAKSLGATALAELRRQGLTPAAVGGLVGIAQASPIS